MSMTNDERFVATAYTGILFCDWSDFHEFAEKLLKRPLFTHEFASKELWMEMKHQVKADFMRMVKPPEQKP